MAYDLVIDLENTPGALAKVAAAISDAGVNIAAATCLGPGERAELHILVKHPEAARHSLAISHDVTITREREVVVVDVEDQPGVLADLTRRIAQGGREHRSRLRRDPQPRRVRGGRPRRATGGARTARSSTRSTSQAAASRFESHRPVSSQAQCPAGGQRACGPPYSRHHASDSRSAAPHGQLADQFARMRADQRA